MAFQPSDIAEGFLAGQREALQKEITKQDMKFRGLQLEQIQKDIRAKDRAEQKAQRIESYVQGYLGQGNMQTDDVNALGSPLAPPPNMREEAAKRLRMEGPEGRAVLQSLQEQEKAEREAALAEIKQWGPAVMEMTGEERNNADVWLAERLTKAETIGRGVARAYLQKPPGEREELLRAVMGGDTSRISGDWVEYDRGDGSTIMMNEADPEDQDMIRKNRNEWRPVPTKTLTGELPKGEETDLRNYESATATFIDRGNALLELLESDPNANTVVSAIERAGMNLVTEARQLANDAGFESVRDEIEDYDEAGINSFLEEQGITSARMKGQIIALAYMQAKIFDKGGRVTDKDFKAALESIGANNSNPNAFAATLRDQMRLAERGFRRDYRYRMNADYEGDLGLRPSKDSPKEDIPEISSDEEYANLPSGALFIGPDGVKRRKP